ncbi:hypothetical protein BOX15_Mlig031106g1 [Macrostomum lignano]|uniref:Protein kinase domain-containing protein n=1 Tax=Macrostomum lignano TaxID=282301 RepID=A0A267E1M7_9PLAT|nr:hypothetical protein BOX15_Mlig031106g1 [Macrostomum lignano]
MSERSVSLELLAVDGRRFRCRPDPRHFAPVQGRFGRIFRVRISAAETSESTADETAAVYCADKAGRKLLSCFSILAQLKHDNIVRLIAAARDADSAASVCVLMEWVGAGSLRDLIDRSGCLTEPLIGAHGKQIGSALHYLHSRRILHRNVKCRSALITESGHTKLAGFTACCLLEEDELDASLDVRQFGCFLVEMATGRTGCKEAPESSTNQLRSLCEACAEQQRPRMEQLLQLEFFQTMQSLKPLLSPSPPTPTQALRPVKSDRCLLGGRAEVGASAPEVLLQQRRLGESDATEELDDDDEAGARGLDKYRKTDDEDEDYFELEGTDFEELIEEDENEQDEEDAQACQIDRERLLGRGRFGSVFRADLHGMPAAAYRTTPGCPEETLKQFRASCLILRKLRHDCIVRLVKVLSDSSGCLTVLTELVEGRNLRSILTQRKAGFREGDLRSYCRQIASALLYLHEQRPALVHRNVKCKSVLLQPNSSLKLVGFSLCMRQQRTARPREWGSPCYLAPEVLHSAGAEFTTKSDVWAFGCLVFELASGRPPNAEQSRNFDRLHASICVGSMPSLPIDSSAALGELYRLCTQRRRKRRPGVQHLLALPFFHRSNRPLLERRNSSCQRRKPSLVRQRTTSDSQVVEELQLQQQQQQSKQQQEQQQEQQKQQKQPSLRFPLVTPRLQQLKPKQQQQQQQDLEAFESVKDDVWKGRSEKLHRSSSEGGPVMQRAQTAAKQQQQQPQSEPLFEPINSLPSSNIYPHCQRPHGYCLLINVERFANPSEFPTRNGSLVDVERVSRLLQRLGYRVRSIADPTAAGICKAAMRIALKNHENYDSFVCFLMSHGTNNQIVGSDGQYISLGRIASFFDSDVCAGLAGKPKLFFIQACRGERQQRNFATTRAVAVGASADQVATAITDDDDEAEEPNTGGVLFAPKGVDFFFGYATSEKYIAYRDSQSGSAYIRVLCRVVEAYGAKEDLLQLHTRVTALISRNPQENQFGSKLFQVPDMRSKLTKQFYFLLGSLKKVYSDLTS